MSKDIAAALLAPFEEKDLKHRPGRAGMTFTYADARAVAQRLDDVLGIEGWQFEVKVADGQEPLFTREGCPSTTWACSAPLRGSYTPLR